MAFLILMVYSNQPMKILPHILHVANESGDEPLFDTYEVAHINTGVVELQTNHKAYENDITEQSIAKMTKRELESYEEAKKVSPKDERILNRHGDVIKKKKEMEEMSNKEKRKPEEKAFSVRKNELIARSQAQQCLYALNVICRFYGLNKLA